MEKASLVVYMFTWQYLNALFTVEVPQPSYIVQTGGSVALECNFPVDETLRTEELIINWLYTVPSETAQKEVYVFHKGLEDLSKQDTSYRGRATLLKDKLSTGRAVLQITNVKLTDKGTYSCFIGYRGADYKHIDLVVGAPYRTINKRVKVIQTESGLEEREVTCQSEGYPMAEVLWQSGGDDLSELANTSYTVRSDQLHIVTSVLQIKGGGNDVLQCIFWNKELQQNTTDTFIISGETDLILWKKRRGYFGAILAGIFVVLLLLIFAWWSKTHGYHRNSVSTQLENPGACCMCNKNPSKHFRKRFGDFCRSIYCKTDKGISTREFTDGAILGQSREHVVPCPALPSAGMVSEVEADVHCDQRVAPEEMLG